MDEHLIFDCERNYQQQDHFKRNITDRQSKTAIQKRSEKITILRIRGSSLNGIGGRVLFLVKLLIYVV